MRNNSFFFSFFVIFTFALASCVQKQQGKSDESFNDSIVHTKYAKGFSISFEKNFTRVEVLNPWLEGANYAVYYLYKNDSTQLPDDGFKLKIPLQSIAINTFAYFEFLSQFDELHSVIGVSDGFRIYNPMILDKLRSGTITDLGDPFKLNLEKTFALHPDAILTSAYAQKDEYSERVIAAGIPVIYNIEWMENTPLARAEWIKFIAAFFDKSAQADSIFNAIETRYLAEKELAKGFSKQFSVVSGDMFQDTWYVSGGKSFNAYLFSDAGLDYFYKNDTQSGSIGLDFESILMNFGKADVWFGCDADSYSALLQKDKKYRLLKAVKEKRVFNNKKRITAAGGNDFFESAVANPDFLLHDMLVALHPEAFPEDTLVYIQPLAE